MARKTWIQCPKTHKLIPAEEWYSQRDFDAPYIQPDIAPYQSMATGEIIQSRSHHREHLKRHGLVEIGNEVDHHMKQAQRRPVDDREGRRRAIAEVLNAKGF